MNYIPLISKKYFILIQQHTILAYLSNSDTGGGGAGFESPN